MRRFIWIILFLVTFYSNNSIAQIPDGSTAPDFTFTDINGKSQNLYNYLNQGMYVALDVSATWCDPCWEYTNKGVLDSLYEKFDKPGPKTWKVMFLEADAATDSADLYGTGGNTRGNWVKGHNYLIMNPPGGIDLRNFKNGYDVNFLPTLFLICPDKKVYHDTLNKGSRAKLSTWQYQASQSCISVGMRSQKDMEEMSLRLYPDPVKDELTMSFYGREPGNMEFTIYNCIGQKCIDKNCSATTGLNTLSYNLTALQPGIYTCCITGDNGLYGTGKFIKY
jgi:hypothetical protein